MDRCTTPEIVVGPYGDTSSDEDPEDNNRDGRAAGDSSSDDSSSVSDGELSRRRENFKFTKC